ncbi:MAG: glycerophosphodiester phosphodiesterase family protein [bacterium]
MTQARLARRVPALASMVAALCTACGGSGGGSPRAADAVACLVDSACNRVVAVSSRGSRFFAPEETVAANDLGVAFGAEAISFDVRRSADGFVVLMHDPTVDRTCTGTGAIADLSFDALRGIEVLPPDQRGELGSDEVIFLATTGLKVLVRTPQPIPTLDDAARGLRGRAAMVVNLEVDVAAGVAQVVRQVRALAKLDETVFVADSAAEARAVLAEEPSAVVAVRPYDAGAWTQMKNELGAAGTRIVKMNPGDPGFDAVREDVLASGRKLFVEVLGSTDTLATLAQRTATMQGAPPEEALAAARYVYQASYDSTRLRMVETDRIDTVAPFTADYNLALGDDPVPPAPPGG